MTRNTVVRVGLLAAAVASLVIPIRAQETFAPDAEGFIRNWLVLAPLPSGQSGADGIAYDYLGGEAAIKPKADDKVSNGGVTLTWKAHRTPAYFIDFREIGRAHV